MAKIETTARFRKSMVLSGIMVSLLVQNGKRPKLEEVTAVPTILGAPISRPRGIKAYVATRLRKVLFPIAHRIELRVRSAIEKTSLASNIFDVRNNVTTMKEEISDLRKQYDQIYQLLRDASEATLAKPSSHVGVTPLGDGMLGIGTEYGYLVVHRTNPSLPKLMTGVPARDEEIIAFVGKLLGPGECLLSVGAGSGLAELAAAAKVGKDGSVVVICADEDAANAMRVGASINRFAGIIDIHAEPPGIQHGSEKSKLIDFGKNKPSLFSAETQATLRAVKSRVRLAKIDLAGAELDALRTLRPLIDSNSELPIILSLPPCSEAADASFDLAAVLREFELVACVIDPSTATLREMKDDDFSPSLRSVLLLRKTSRELAQHLPRLSRS